MSDKSGTKIPVNPIFLYIFDIDTIKEQNEYVIINPCFYDCWISLSALVVIRLIQWLAQNHYIEIDGLLTIKIRNKKEYYGVTKEKEVYS